MDIPDKIIFKFQNPRQQRIYTSLLRVVPGPASFYRDACLLMEGNIDLESNTHLVAHLLREMESALRSVMKPYDYVPPEKCEKCGNRPEGHKAEIRAILGVYGIDTSSEVAKLWLQLADQHERIGLAKRAHRNALGFPRKADQDFTDLWEKMEVLLSILVDKIEANYLRYTNFLDSLLAKTVIEKKDVQDLQQSVPNNNVTLGYFFDKLENPGWLKLLTEKGFFSNPPEPIKDLENGGTSFPSWPQAIYLKKMAKLPDQQADVLIASLEVNTENVRAKSDLLEIALLLPIDMAIKILDSNGEIDYWFGPENYGKLVAYLAKEGKSIEALALANKILAIIPDPREDKDYAGYKIANDPIALIRDWSYEQILEKDYPAVVEAVGLPAIQVLTDQLENYIKLKNKDKETDSEEDYSEIWRSAIEDHEQNHEHGIRDVLINGVRDASEQFLKKNPNQIMDLIAELDSKKILIFKRIILHLLRLFPDGAKEKIQEVLMNEHEFSEEERLTHEYFLLAETHASLLDEEQRKQIWAWINKGPNIDMDDYKARCKKAGVEPSDEKIEKHIKRWQMYHLLPFKDIDPAWKKYYEELVSILGEPEYPSLRSWSHGGSYGPISTLSSDQFKEMKTSDVIEHLRTWEPPSHDPLDVSREGTGRELTAQVTADPEKWLSDLTSFSELDPTFVRSVLTGYRDSIRQDKRFNWEPILELCEVILAKPIEIKDRTPSEPFGDDPDWNWCRNTVAELLKEGLLQNPGMIPTILREKTWSLIEILTNDTDPTPEREKQYLESHPDALTAAINSTRGNAMEVAFQYGIWLKKSVPESTQPTWSFKKDAPELFQVLNSHLDISKDPSLGVRALYGERLGTLGWLDTGWVKDNQHIIFPSDPSQQKFFDAAWETYMTYSPAYHDLYEILKTQYERAIQEIGTHTDSKHHLTNPEQNLVGHLINFYCKGLIELEGDLLSNFYLVAPLELKGEVIDFIGRSSKKNAGMSPEIREKFVVLLEQRLSIAKTSNNKQVDAQEFENFSWWIASEKFDDKWTLDMLLEIAELGCDIEDEHLVVERFSELAPRYPLEVIRCSNLLVQNDRKGWGIAHWGEQMYAVIKLVLKSGNEEAKQVAKEFTHRLAALGHLQFKDLLETPFSI